MKYYYNIFFNWGIVLIIIRWLGFFVEVFWDIIRFKGKFFFKNVLYFVFNYMYYDLVIGMIIRIVNW